MNSFVNCSNCNVPLSFQAVGTVLKVCGRCGTPNTRKADFSLPAVSAPAEDNTLLKLGTTGKYDKLGFTLIGRVQYLYNEGYTNFWLAHWADGDLDWLAEWEGGYAWIERKAVEPGEEMLKTEVEGAIDIEGQSFTAIRESQHWKTGWEGELPTFTVEEDNYKMLELGAEGDKTAKIHFYSSAYSEIFYGEFDYFETFGFTNLRN